MHISTNSQFNQVKLWLDRAEIKELLGNLQSAENKPKHSTVLQIKAVNTGLNGKPVTYSLTIII
jgi:hypothetical protein